MKKKIGLACILRNAKIYFLLLGIGMPLLSFSQTFSKEKDKFIKEIQRAFTEPDMENNVRVIFPQVISSTGFSESTFGKMVDGANAIFTAKGDARLTYYYVASFIYQNKNKFDNDFSSAWAGLEKEYRNKEDEKYSEFMQFSYGLFRYKALQKNDNVLWTYKGSMEWNLEKKPKIICTDGQLSGYSVGLKEKDSVFVAETFGVFDLETKKFVGRNGTITWEKVGFSKAETFAELKGYRVDMNKVVLKADTVSLTTPYFKTPILGVLYDKAIDELKEGEGGAPLFNSFEKRLKIPALREGMDYDGGFSLEGNRFVGKGIEGNPAKLIYKENGKPLIEISGLLFTIDPNQILARQARFKLSYANGDSLIQSDGMYQFNDVTKEMTVSPNKKGGVVVPFIDYHFKVTCNAPVLKWIQGTPFPKYTFEMATSQAQKIIQFESFNYFDEALYNKLGNSGGGNPLNQIANYCKKNNLTTLTEGQASSALGTTIEYAKTRLLELASLNFLNYNTFEKTITPLPKLYSFSEAKTAGKDYDNLSFVCDLTQRKITFSEESLAQNPQLKSEKNKLEILNNRYAKQDYFAFIDLAKNQMFLTGVDEVVLSQAQKTFLQPDSTYIIVKPNLDLDFKGNLNCGKFVGQVQEGYFSYVDFKIKLNKLSYAGLVVNPLRKEDGQDPIELLSSFANLKGELLIDQPTSRAGQSKTNGNYPKLLVPGISKVVYNDPSIVKGAYDSARFYYRLDPFELDSLDNFNEIALRFNGSLISGGIFPPIKEPLKIMNDYAFGFSTVAPEGGLAFYGDNSKYENKIILSHNGLQGAGTINYNTATAISQKLTFLPDSTIGIAKFENKESITGIKVPLVKSEAAYITFLPKKQVLKASAWRDVNLQMFNNQCEMEGMVVLSKNGMNGNGKLRFPDATLESKNFVFTHEDIHADTSAFALKNRYVTQGAAPIAMETKDVKADVSFKTRKGEFNSFGTKRIKFPPNQYYCTMDKFFWYMDRSDVDFEKSKSPQTTFEAGADLDEPNFFSMHDDQDTLQFRSLLARYDLKLQTIFCGKVEYIRVGDAKIYPDSMKVTIRKEAKMDPLLNAKIVAPFVTKYHTFTQANVNVTSRVKYEGTAKYPYYDRDSVLTVLTMKTIKYQNAVTQAEGDVAQKDNFKLSTEFDYYGKVKIVAASPGVYCEGSTRINHNCTSFDRSWLSFKDTILAKNIQIPISENPLNDVGNRLAVGFLWKNSESMDSVKVYPAFLSKIQGKEDPIVFQSSGYVQFNPKGNVFQIASKARLNDNAFPGNMLTLYTETCSLSGMGKIDFGVDLGEVKATSYGDINYESVTKKIKLDLTTLLKFPMQKDVFENIGNELKVLEGQKAADLRSKKINFSMYVRHFLSEDKVNDLFKDYEEDKLKKLPEELDVTLLMSGVKMEFAQFKTKTNESGFSRGWVTKVSAGDTETDNEGDEVKSKSRVAILGIEGRPVLKDVEMNFMVGQTSMDASYQGLILNFKNTAGKDYFFDYSMNKKDGKLAVFSNEPTLKTMVTEMKPDKRKSKNFSFEWADDVTLKLAMSKLNEYLKSK